MTIARRIGIGYAGLSVACLVLVAWLGYHEFVKEPAEFAAMGLPGIHKDTGAETSTLSFLALVPVLLGCGWWWVSRVLRPLNTLTTAVENIHSENLRVQLPRSMSGDEVDRLAGIFNSMTVRLDDSFRRIHEFTLRASHELKTPLTAMRGHLELVLLENKELPREQVAWVQGQLDEVNRLTRIVDSLTLLTKADAGLIELGRELVQLAPLVEEATEDATVLAQSHGVKAVLLECEPALVAGDRHRIRQLLLILTDNAAKYNRPGGMIHLSLRKQGERAVVQITNTGRRPQDRNLESLFERFARGDNAREKAEGCGLGLTIAQWIVQAHGGEIRLLPEAEDLFTVQVSLPLCSPQAVGG